MSQYRIFVSSVLFAVGILAVTACEPYMSMTDQVPAQTRRAAALLPEEPQFVGMVDVESGLAQVESLLDRPLADHLDDVDHPYLRSFLEATEFELGSDLKAVYGATVGENEVSFVVFGDLTSEQMDGYLEHAPDDAGRTATYREVPLYHLALGLGEESDGTDSLTVAFVGEGTMAVAKRPAEVRAMVDRHKAAKAGLESNEPYMTLINRVGRESTAWLVGRNVVETALTDSAALDTLQASVSRMESGVNSAGVQGALVEWSDRVLGLSEVSRMDGRAGDRLDRLTRRLREQAISIRLTEDALEGQAYLTMQDESSASSVVDVAQGAVAVLKLSRERLDERHRDLLDDVEVEREGAIVRIRFSLDREMLRKHVDDEQASTAVHRTDASIHHASSTLRRMGSITSR